MGSDPRIPLILANSPLKRRNYIISSKTNQSSTAHFQTLRELENCTFSSTSRNAKPHIFTYFAIMRSSPPRELFKARGCPRPRTTTYCRRAMPVIRSVRTRENTSLADEAYPHNSSFSSHASLSPQNGASAHTPASSAAVLRFCAASKLRRPGLL